MYRVFRNINNILEQKCIICKEGYILDNNNNCYNNESIEISSYTFGEIDNTNICPEGKLFLRMIYV